MQTKKSKHKNKFDLTVVKTCDKKKLVVFCIRYTNFVIKKYVKKTVTKTRYTSRLTLSPHYFQ